MLKQNISILEKEYCSGCGSCYNTCPHSAITMLEDEEGFIAPLVDEDKCVYCDECVPSCHMLNSKFSNRNSPECYATFASDDIREKSSSGGVFSVAANYILDNGGYVCGAAFNKEWEVEHIIVDSKEDLPKLKGSKYVESITYKIFKDIKKLLDAGKVVLFSGCPCQVSGLYGFLDKEYNNLITMDLICHGVPSPKVWEVYLSQNFNKEDIKHISFRDNKLGWSNSYITIFFDDGSVYQKSISIDTYFRGFLQNLFLRDTCTHCRFATVPRQGDITIGDFWGIEGHNKKYNDNKGLSIVLINNSKGDDFFSKINNTFQLNKKVPTSFALFSQRCLEKPVKPHPNRRMFFNEFISNKYKNFNNLTQKYLISQSKYDICLFAPFSFNNNYGAILTNYGLFKAIENLGFSATIINTKNILLYQPDMGMDFLEKYSNITEECNNYFDLVKTNDICDTFIVGSDQVWGETSCIMFLHFAHDNKKKISYSTSLGGNKYDQANESNVLIKYLLSKFDHISVREYDGVDTLKNAFGIDAVQKIDPIFLCDIKNYEMLACQSKLDIKTNYIFCYILNLDERMIDSLIKISSNTKKDIIIVTWNSDIKKYFKQNDKNITVVFDASPEDWLYYIKNADFVITNSFHGACFSIIFNKDFIAIARNLLSRFETLFKRLGIKDRLVEKLKDIIESPSLFSKMDYASINKKLEIEKENSIKWLNNAILSKKIKKISPENEIISCLIETNSVLEKQLILLESDIQEEIEINRNKLSLFGIYSNKKYLKIVFLGIKMTFKRTDNNKFINTLAWWIPVQKLRDAFRAKFG